MKSSTLHLKNLAFSFPHTKIFVTHHCGKEPCEVFQRRESDQDAKYCSDHADCLESIFSNQIKYKYYGGNKLVSI